MKTMTPAEARAAHCWFDTDRVSGDAATTAWKRTARLRQARWREAQGHPIGAQPYRGGAGATPVGSRMALDVRDAHRRELPHAGVLAAVRARLDTHESHEMLSEDRLWADLLSSMPLCFNLFGELAHDQARADRAVHTWWPDAPAGRVEVKFEHSPARRDPAYLGNNSAFDAAFVVGDTAIVGVETKYHEHAKAEAPPKQKALARYVEVTERSGAFRAGWRKAIIGTDLQQIWLDHLLLLSMLQHPSGQWTWGRFVLVSPAGNPSFAAAADRYRGLLADDATFETKTIEELLAAKGALPDALVTAFRARYL